MAAIRAWRHNNAAARKSLLLYEMYYEAASLRSAGVTRLRQCAKSLQTVRLARTVIYRLRVNWRVESMDQFVLAAMRLMPSQEAISRPINVETMPTPSAPEELESVQSASWQPSVGRCAPPSSRIYKEVLMETRGRRCIGWVDWAPDTWTRTASWTPARIRFATIRRDQPDLFGKQEAAVTVIQGGLAGWFERGSLKKRRDAAMIIQSTASGAKERQRIRCDLVTADLAALSIQGSIEGRRVRSDHAAMVADATRLQAALKGKGSRERHAAMAAATCVIQSGVVGWEARSEMCHMARAARAVQGGMAGFDSRRGVQAVHTRLDSAASLLGGLKRHQVRTKRRREEYAVERIQAVAYGREARIRGRQTLERIDAQSGAALSIQGSIEGRRVRSDHAAMVADATRLQAALKGKGSRERHAAMAAATCVIQSGVVGWEARSEMCHMARAARAVQAGVNGHATRVCMARCVNSERDAAAIQIQARFVGYSVRSGLSLKESAVCVLQGALLGHAARLADYQRRWEEFQHAEDLLLGSICRLQSLVRGATARFDLDHRIDAVYHTAINRIQAGLLGKEARSSAAKARFVDEKRRATVGLLAKRHHENKRRRVTGLPSSSGLGCHATTRSTTAAAVAAAARQL